MYELTFQEAIERCAKGEGFIRGELFKSGVYVKRQGETLVAVDGLNSNRVIGNLYISTAIMTQKYKLFNNVAVEELTDGAGRLHNLYSKAV
ncbi:MAG: hypothetical protein ACOZCL_13410 [Bacillota bacterium]